MIVGFLFGFIVTKLCADFIERNISNKIAQIIIFLLIFVSSASFASVVFHIIVAVNSN